jgi:hypothetical protein
VCGQCACALFCGRESSDVGAVPCVSLVAVLCLSFPWLNAAGDANSRVFVVLNEKEVQQQQQQQQDDDDDDDDVVAAATTDAFSADLHGLLDEDGSSHGNSSCAASPVLPLLGSGLAIGSYDDGAIGPFTVFPLDDVTSDWPFDDDTLGALADELILPTVAL